MKHTATILIAIVSTAALLDPSVAEEFPYSAVVGPNGATVRCGPNDSFYSTSHLETGFEVEVYKQTKDGWCAIRPTGVSFSLIPSNQVQLGEGDSLAEVIDSKAVSWIGSTADAPGQMLWQVKLKVGEVVEIIGLSQRDSAKGNGKEVWYKIRPPAGEFRYVRASEITRMNDASEIKALADRAVRPANYVADDAPEQEAPQASGWKVVRSPRAQQDHPTGAERVEILETADARHSVADHRPPTTSNSNLDPETELAEINVALVRLAATPIEDWDFSAIEERLSELDRADTSVKQRTSMVRIRNRLKQYAALKKKQEGIEPSVEPKSTPVGVEPEDSIADAPAPAVETPVGTGVAEPIAPLTIADESIPAEYDGVGYLMPVISRQQQAPPFALLDKKGNVLGFVSPQPGLNLRRYLKKEIGVIGQKGYLPKYQATHLTAQRVIVLDRHR